MNPNTLGCKYQEALDPDDYVISTNPDSELRTEAADLGYYDELMGVREQVLEFLADLRRGAP